MLYERRVPDDWLTTEPDDDEMYNDHLQDYLDELAYDREIAREDEEEFIP